MVPVTTLRELFAYNYWARDRQIEACAALSQEQFERAMGNSFSSVRDTLAHLVGVEWLWLERWNGRMPAGLLPANDFPTLISIRQCWAEIGNKLLTFAANLKVEDLARVHGIRTTKGEPYSHPLWEMMQHLVNHGTYHRGQVTTMLRQLGAQPVATDLIAFYRQQRRAPKS